MKKFLFLLLASFLVLAACGQEESKPEDKKETKSSDKDGKEDNDKKSNDKKSKDTKEESEKSENEDGDNKEIANEENHSQEQTVQENNQEQQVEQEPNQSQEQTSVEQEPTDQEIAEANAEVAKEYGYTGIPNGDAHLTGDDLAEREAFLEQLHEETKDLDEDDIPEFTEEEQEAAMDRNEAELEAEGLK